MGCWKVAKSVDDEVKYDIKVGDESMLRAHLLSVLVLFWNVI